MQTRDVYVYLQPRIGPGEVARTEEAVPGRVLIDYAADGSPLGVEVLAAIRVTEDGAAVPRGEEAQ